MKTHRRILQLIDELLPWLIELRHRLHQFPEPSLGEEQTAAVLAGELGKLGLTVRTNVAETGVVADLETGRPGARVVIRADMDALPVEESTGLPYQSRNPGLSHCCGHDGHATCVVGAAAVLAGMGEALTGSVRFVFQPAEETAQGALMMVEAGVLSDPPVAAVFSLHSWPGLAPECVACIPGPFTASSNTMTIRVLGKGGHGARPHLARNPLPGMARVIAALDGLNTERRVISLCTAHAGQKSNVIADAGTLSGTLRALDEEIRRESTEVIVSRAKEACAEAGLRAEVSFGRTCPMTFNDERLYRRFFELGAALLGAECVQQLEAPSMGSEDFGYFMQRVPGLIFRLGMGRDSAQLHNGDFDFNDTALRPGAAMLAALALRTCNEGMPA